jgi:SAM-dependent methyltransferase
MMLTDRQRSKLDTSNDLLFYDTPRLVTHVDRQFIHTLTELYRDRLQPQTRILDLMSSWVSHLPPEITFSEVVGHGMNAEELAQNPRLHRYHVQNLNQDQVLPYGDRYFDAVLNTVSVQYLQFPERVFAEIHRILKPGGIVIISFSNRMFYQKAIQAWRDGSDHDRLHLVAHYLGSVTDGFTKPEAIVQAPAWGLNFWGGSSDPFYAVIAHRQPHS